MGWLWRLLFFSDPAAGGRVLWPPRFPRLVEPWQKLLFLVVLALCALAAWWVYKREPAYVDEKRKRQLTALRIAGVVVVLFALTGAYLDVQRQEPGRHAVVVLVDKSASMSIPDRYEGTPDADAYTRLAGTDQKALDALPREELVKRVLGGADGPLAKLAKKGDLEVFAFGAEAQIAGVDVGLEGADKATAKLTLDGLPEPKDTATRLGDALRDAARRLKGRRVDGVVVVSDGGSNRGDDPVEAAKDLGSPVFAVGVGQPQHKDLAVTFLFAEDVVFRGDTFPLTVRIRQRGYDNATVRLIVRRDDEIVREDQVTLDASLETVHEVDIQADKTGTFAYSAEIEAMPDEVVTDNNKKTKAGIRVVDKKIRVLVVDDGPRWETRYLSSVLESDRARIAPTFVIRQADERLLQADTRYRKTFPGTPAELRAYDVIVFGNMPADFFTAKDLEALESFVKEDGGGLLLVAGRNHMPDEYANTPLANLLPVEFEAAPKVLPDDETTSTIKEGFRPILTPEGRRNPVLRFAPEAGENEAMWAKAETIRWYHRSTALKPGASVLLAHPDGGPDGGGAPIMVSQRYGKGQVLYLATDETWRWRYHPGPAQHRKLWGQAIGSLSMAHLLGKTNRIQLESEKSEYAVGERATIIARILDKDFNKLVVDSVQAVAARSDLDKQPITLEPVADQPGMYKGEFVASAEGNFRVAIVGEEDEAELPLAIVDPKIEFDDPGMRQELLTRIADASGGDFMTLAQAGDLPDRIAQRRVEPPPKREERTLWNAPGVVVLFSILFGLEWFLRKRSDLL